MIKNSNNSTWMNNKPFQKDISNELNRIIYCENDANCFALSEATDGSASHYKIVFGVILGSGCGGGLISEPMARLGANVTGIDASEKNIKIAQIHSKENNLKINYIHSSPERLKEKEEFDIILNLEIIEHVEDVELYVDSCSKLLKKGGLMFTATLNRTVVSYIKAIVGAEYILRWLPIGTHDWNKFIRPEELEKKLSIANFKTIEVKGLEFNPFNKKWKKSDNLSVNYIICSSKI
jgi:2-polyprenyl-6-hydroxyphenyl methylase/3-demethylubiquinone-9 3-methyltransferase